MYLCGAVRAEVRRHKKTPQNIITAKHHTSGSGEIYNVYLKEKKNTYVIENVCDWVICYLYVEAYGCAIRFKLRAMIKQ